MTFRPWALGAVAAMLVALASIDALEALRNSGQKSDGPNSFDGRWSVVGRIQTLAAESERTASIVSLSGAVVLSNGAGLSRGFHGEAIALDDARQVSAGRAVWTDANGDRVFSVLNAGRLETGRRVHATITGGTGRYAGLTGEYAFTWQYVTAGEGDTLQGRAADIKGWFRWPR